MKKEEIKACKTIAEEMKSAIQEAEECDIFAKDKDGGYKHNVMVFLSKIEHIQHIINDGWFFEKLKWKEYGL